MTLKEGKAEIWLGAFFAAVGALCPLALVPHQLEVTYTPDSFEYICAFGQYGYGIVVAKASEDPTYKEILANSNLTWACMTGDEYETLVRDMYQEFGEKRG